MTSEMFKVTSNLFMLNNFDFTTKQNRTNMILITILCGIPQRGNTNLCGVFLTAVAIILFQRKLSKETVC